MQTVLDIIRHCLSSAGKEDKDMGFISRQPNGLLCRFSPVVESITHYNMTDEQYIDGCTGNVTPEEAKEIIAHHLVDFSQVKITTLNQTPREVDRLYEYMQLNYA